MSATFMSPYKERFVCHSRFHTIDDIMGRSISHSTSSSIDSNSTSKNKNGDSGTDLSTDLRLGLSISHINDLSSSTTSSQREQSLDWPPVKHLSRSSVVAGQKEESLFVKVYMESVPIGRKLDLIALDGYNGLITTLCHMFNTNILCSEIENRVGSGKCHVLTYEDGEGDWMMVGDVPWEMFLSSVRRLKITRADRC